ncbi:PREDICTED: carbon catabolite repressor protein 4 homolog 6-like [Camelina sativa]|uniref:Carbon catabolite repressor protein 4 homolog 6-like n=1 Tax=Camelina sativa TaxID=90675 RepID=A0ABM0TEP0_CAMSA|nr:PREDICTED: carbon catabolite repressor protein 4 homolog 6-like [Camelina sativa]
MRRSRFVSQVFSDVAFADTSTLSLFQSSPPCLLVLRWTRCEKFLRSSVQQRRRKKRQVSSLLKTRIFSQFMTPISDSGMVNNLSLRLVSGSNHPFNQKNYGFRPPPPSQGQWQQFRQPNHPPSNQSYTACLPPPFYQNQMSPPRSFRQRPRSKPSDYREWEHAKTPLPPGPGSGKFC